MTRTRHRITQAPALDAVVAPVGRWPAPALVESDPHGRPLARPFPRWRVTVRRLLRLAGVGATVALAIAGVPPPLVAAAVVVLVGLAPRRLAERLVALPHPTFLTVGYVHPHTLTAHEWIRLPDGWAVQTYDTRVVTPATLGDPTPPVVRMRCSDDTTRTFRPHDFVHVVVPVDLT